MAIKLTEKIDLKFQIGTTISTFPVTAFLSLSKEKEKAFEEFKEEQEAKNKAMEDAIDLRGQLSKRIARLSQDIDFINDDLADDALDDEEARDLRQERRHLSLKLRTLEDEMEKHLDEHDVASYQKAITVLVEDTAAFSFDINVEADDKRDDLVAFMERNNIKYASVVSEMGRLISDAKTKKKKRS